jgi:hypothetical protein
VTLLLLLRNGTTPTTALASVAAIKEFLQKPVSDTTQDALLASMADRATAAIEREIGREFRPTIAETRVFSYDGNGRVTFSPSEARSVSAVVWDYGVTAETLSSSGGWSLRNSDPFAGTYGGLYLPGHRHVRCQDDQTAVAVTGNWGFAQVPADVEHACIVTVSVWLREVAAYNLDGDTALAFTRRGAVPQDVLDGLSNYRMPVV